MASQFLQLHECFHLIHDYLDHNAYMQRWHVNGVVGTNLKLGGQIQKGHDAEEQLTITGYLVGAVNQRMHAWQQRDFVRIACDRNLEFQSDIHTTTDAVAAQTMQMRIMILCQ